LFGVFIMLFSYGVFRARKLSWPGKAAAVFFLIGGILMYLVGIFPSDGMLNNSSDQARLHEIAANYPFLFMTIGFLLFLGDAFKRKELRWVIPAIIILGPLALVAFYYHSIFQATIPLKGYVQRIAIGFPFIIVAILSHYLIKLEKN